MQICNIKIVFLLLAVCFYLAMSKHRRCNHASRDPVVRNGTTPKKGYMVKSFEEDKNKMRAVTEQRVQIIDSNMRDYDQDKVIDIIQNAYDSTDNPLDRARKLQYELAIRYRSYPHVVINYDVDVYYQNFYIFLKIDGDRIGAWGL